MERPLEMICCVAARMAIIYRPKVPGFRTRSGCGTDSIVIFLGKSV